MSTNRLKFRHGKQREFANPSQELAHLLSGITGFHAYVMQLAGLRQLVVAGIEAPSMPTSSTWPAPSEVWCTAGGVALLAQVDPGELADYLDADPWPTYTERTHSGPDAVRELIDQARAGDLAIERGWTVPGSGCVAIPWSRDVPAVPTAIALIGREPEMDAQLAMIERLLRAAVLPGSTRESVVLAARP